MGLWCYKHGENQPLNQRRGGTPREPSDRVHHGGDHYDLLIFDLGRFGTAIGLRLKNKGLRVLRIDFNPLAARRWRNLGLDTEYGDATDPEFVAALPLKGTEWVVSPVPVHPTDIVLEPFQDAADRAVDLLTGGEQMERTAIPGIETEEKIT
jgi:voltage-gated potassium channel Kch